MIKLIRNSAVTRYVSCFLAVCILSEIGFPITAYALSGGPSQPEVQSFEPVGTSEMVDLFSGDFNYNIPLLDVGGYPINISYHSGITTDQEASWVGLGWNINPGVINRNMRGLPDDFDGDEVTKQFNMKGSKTYGISGFLSTELIGMDKLKPAASQLKQSKLAQLSFGLGLNYNNYTGVGFEISASPGLSAGDKSKGSLSLGLGLSASSEGGVSISPTVSLARKQDQALENDVTRSTSTSLSIGSSFNSRTGFTGLTISASYNRSLSQAVRDKNNALTGESNTTASRGANGGSTISFASQTYTPQIKMSLTNLSLSLAATIGLAGYGVHGSVKTRGYYSGQFLFNNSETHHAFGYLYSQHGNYSTYSLHDFNREKDGAYSEFTPNLPLTNFTYDIYAVSGQGIGGMYRPHRSDIGIVYDTKTMNYTGGLDLGGIEIGGGAIVHGGLNTTLNESDAYSGKWQDGDEISNVFNFAGREDLFYEPVYFTQAGEKTMENPDDQVLFNTFLGGYDPVRVVIGGDGVTAKSKLSKPDGTVIDLGGLLKRKQRARRNEAIALLRADEAKNFALEKQISLYDLNGSDSKTPDITPSYMARTEDGVREAHHTSEISTFRADGARYVYGIAAYNHNQSEVSFAVNGTGNSEGLVHYSSGENSTGNTSALDNFFDKTNMPAFAHSYLLTAVLPPEYVDVDGNGPSDNDLGGYTKINYSRIDGYQWRTPFDENYANYNEGLRSKSGSDGDNKGSYVYGMKELWYVHSIESKDYVAYFFTSDRPDALGVKGENGGKGTASGKSRRLDRIVMYAKQELRKWSNDFTKAVPIKSVYFDYSYVLCPGIKNSATDGGKLTLTGLYFTYGNSTKAKQRGYKFYYGADLSASTLSTPTSSAPNYSYGVKSYDRWGNYKGGSEQGDFPYTDQDKTTADTYAAAWTMNAIELPSGGIIKVKYEADDYAYVQDKKAMQMFKVIGSSLFRESYGGPTSPLDVNLVNKLYDNNNFSCEYIYVKLQDGGVSNEAELRYRYFCESNGQLMPFLYYKFLVAIESGGEKEWIPGYIKSSAIDFGLCKGSGWTASSPPGKFEYAWIRLKSVPLDDRVPFGNANPIAHTAWNFVKMNLPHVAYDNNDTYDNVPVIAILTAIFSTLKQMSQLLTGFYSDLRSRDIAQTYDTDKSFVRLYTPSGKKRGGGARVAKIEIDDRFNAMNGNSDVYENAVYGQKYDYTKKDEYGNVISSGVAAYEPLIGGEENPFRQPLIREEKKLLVPGADYIQEEPFGESFFPGASVGYSEVTVRNIRSDSPSDDEPQNTTGKVVHEFYTARDFPTIVSRTTTDPHRDRGPLALSLFKLFNKETMVVSQGYCIELNDMHGKPKGQKVYAAKDDDTPVSSVKYTYRTDPANGRHLSNSVQTMSRVGEVSWSDMVGVEYDMIADMREQTSASRSTGEDGNLETFVVFIPLAIPMILPSYSEEETLFRSVVVTKVINRYGILESTTAQDLSSVVTTSNQVYDQETGEVLLTKTINQYDDPMYHFTYPAHWAYGNMGPAYSNLGVSVPLAEAYAHPQRYFVPGDEVALGATKGWVYQASENELVIMDASGTKILQQDIGAGFVKVLRSGRKNQQNTPMASFTSMTDPLANTDGDPALELVYRNILQAEATEFTEESKLFCECGLEKDVNGKFPDYNPYLKGSRGFWKVKRKYLRLTDRTQTRFNGNVNTRRDGVFTRFSPFYSPTGGGLWSADPSGWVFTSEVSQFSPYGHEIENRDALGRYSSAVYGYNNKLPVAIAANARYTQVGVDNFEDYNYYTCANQDQHFGFRKKIAEITTGLVVISDKISHTGRNSLLVKPGPSGYENSIRIRKVLNPCPLEVTTVTIK